MNVYKIRMIGGPEPITIFKDANYDKVFREFAQIKEKYPAGTLEVVRESDKKVDTLWFNNTLLNKIADKEARKPEVKEEGKKYDSNKPMAGAVIRVFPQAIMAIGAVIRKGTEKYPTPNNWKLNKNIEARYFDSLMRHMCKHFAGQVKDEDTGLLHLIHAAWNSIAILEKYLIDHPEVAKEIMYPKEIRE